MTREVNRKIAKPSKMYLFSLTTIICHQSALDYQMTGCIEINAYKTGGSLNVSFAFPYKDSVDKRTEVSGHIQTSCGSKELLCCNKIVDSLCNQIFYLLAGCP